MQQYKIIKLHPDTYNHLTALLEPKESYSKVVERLLKFYNDVKLSVLISEAGKPVGVRTPTEKGEQK